MKSYKTLPFDNIGYFFILLLVVVALGFSPSYFFKVGSDTTDFSVYTHFHAFMMTTWMFSLITQPFLIRYKQFKWHQILGKIAYIQVPLLMISVLLLAHHTLQSVPEHEAHIYFYTPFKEKRR